MDHNNIRHKLSEYIDDAVSPQERAAIDEHLKNCTVCTDALAELRKTIEAVKQIEAVDAPAWMTSKIMANVRAATGQKKSIFHRLFYPLAVKLPIHAVGALFLTVTAYYLYTSTHSPEKSVDAPMGRLAKQGSPVAERDAVTRKAPETPAELERKVSQEAGYKSLDMKYSYEKPAAPIPAEQPAAAPAASALAPAKSEEYTPSTDKADLERRGVAARKKAAGPSLTAEQPAPAAGSALSPVTAEQAAPIAGKASSARESDRDAEARLAVMEHFAKNDLPESAKVRGLHYDVRKVQTGTADLQWLSRTKAYRSMPCTDRYVVEVDLSGGLSKYLYCNDRSSIRLLGVFELKNNTWSEK